MKNWILRFLAMLTIAFFITIGAGVLFYLFAAFILWELYAIPDTYIRLWLGLSLLNAVVMSCIYANDTYERKL